MEKPKLSQDGRIDFMMLKQAVLILRTLNNSVCQKIFRQLEINPEMTVTEIYTVLNLEQSVASMHLAKMRRHRIVTTKRNGKNILYILNVDRLSKINVVVKQLNTSSVL
jgi:DNA-binding transcriptional ArsR family regulator